MSKMIQNLCKWPRSMGKKFQFQIVLAVLKHPNYPDPLGTFNQLNGWFVDSRD